MSARRRKPTSPELDYRNGGIELAKLRAWSILLRYQQIVGDGSMMAKSVNSSVQRGRGRPRSTPLEKAVTDYLFDTLHFKDLREAGYGNVPSDRTVLDDAVRRHFPEVMDSPTKYEKARARLKDAVKYRKRKYAG